MKNYATVEGKLIAKNENMLEKGLKHAKREGFITKNNTLLDASGSEVGNGSCVQDNIIVIPLAEYTNFHLLMQSLIRMGFTFKGSGYSTDGVFEGYHNGKIVDLATWAKNADLDKDKPDPKENPEDFFEWQEEVAETFFKHYKSAA